MNNQNPKNCEECFRIKCKKCGWELDETQLQKVQSGELKNCPNCGSSPSN